MALPGRTVVGWASSVYLFSLAVRDETGSLAWITRELAQHGINLRGFVVDPAGMQLLVTDLAGTRATLDALGFLYRVTAVHEAELDDRPGALSQLCQELAAAHINIRMAFGVSGNDCARVYLDMDILPVAAPIIARYRRGPRTP